jgi:hypothetical protein
MPLQIDFHEQSTTAGGIHPWMNQADSVCVRKEVGKCSISGADPGSPGRCSQQLLNRCLELRPRQPPACTLSIPRPRLEAATESRRGDLLPGRQCHPALHFRPCRCLCRQRAASLGASPQGHCRAAQVASSNGLAPVASVQAVCGDNVSAQACECVLGRRVTIICSWVQQCDAQTPIIDMVVARKHYGGSVLAL